MGYHPYVIGFLTLGRKPVKGQCQVGSLTGAVASESVSEALKGSLRMVGNHPKSAKAEGSLTATPTGGAGTKVGPVSYTHLDVYKRQLNKLSERQERKFFWKHFQ